MNIDVDPNIHRRNPRLKFDEFKIHLEALTSAHQKSAGEYDEGARSPHALYAVRI